MSVSDDIDIGYSLDPSGYLVGINQIDQANQRLSQSMAGVVSSTSMLSRAIGTLAPSRAMASNMLAMADAAAKSEQAMSGLHATAVTTGADFGKLSSSVRSLARDFPIGRAGAQQMVEMFTKLGVASAGSEAKIDQLARTAVKMSGATGESMQALGQGMTDFSRATGNINLDPKRFAALGDSLTTISAQSGASASGILSFGKAIAPMANAAGIGTTGITGIASAFSKLGEDGTAASTTVSKMLSDINRSIREGGPEIKTYAAMVGQTTDQFQALFKMDPGKALSQITESIARSGPTGQRQLEAIGIEGIRGQRALQAVSATGGLQKAQDDAAAAYGSGSTSKAAETAFGGLADAVEEAKESFAQISEALGAPLLGPLTAFTKSIKAVAGVVGDIAESPVGQVGMSAAAGVGGLASIAGPIISGVGLYAMARQMATSRPVRSLAAGLGAGRDNFLTRFGAPATAMIDPETGRVGEGRIGAVSGGIYQAGRGLGALRGDPEERVNARRMDFLRRNGLDATLAYEQSMKEQGRRPFRAGIIGAAESYASFQRGAREQIQNADRPIGERTPVTGVTPSLRQAWSRAAGDAEGSMARLSAGMRNLGGELNGVTTPLRSMGRAVGETGRLLTSSLGLPIRDAARGIKAGAGSISMGGYGGMLGMAAVSAGIAGITALYEGHKEDLAQIAALSGQSITAPLDMYREKAGVVTGPQQTWDSMRTTTSQNLARSATSTSVNTVSAADRAAVKAGQYTNKYSGGVEAVTEQIRNLTPGQLLPSDLQLAKQDLIAQGYSDADINKIITNVQGPASGSFGNVANTAADLAGSVSGGFTGGLNQFLRGAASGVGSPRPGTEEYAAGLRASGNDVLYKSPLSEEQRKQVTGLVNTSVQLQADAQAKGYSSDYADQQKYAQAEKIYKEVSGQGNADLDIEVQRQLGKQLTGKDIDFVVTPQDVQKAGGYIQALIAGAKDRGIDVGGLSTGYSGFQQRQAAAGGSFVAEQVPGITQKIAGGLNTTMGQMFSPAGPGAGPQFLASAAIQASMEHPENQQAQGAAAASMIAGMTKAGQSSEEVSKNLFNLANAVSSTDQAFRIAQEAISQLAEGSRTVGIEHGAKAGQMDALAKNMGIASGPEPTDPAMKAQWKAARETVQGINEQVRGELEARLTARYNYQKQVTRSERDFGIQMQRQDEALGRQISRTREQAQVQESRSIDAFNRQKEYAEYDYQKQRGRIIRDYGTTLARETEDFNTSRLYAQQDFQKNSLRAEQDYQKQRQRTIRDFNKQLARQIEDAAATMMNPYERIRAKPTWDTDNLMVNMAEQTKSMQDQVANLEKLRKQGLSAQTIDVLGLGKAENAQQLQNIMGDMTPAKIAQLNTAAAAQAKAAGGLFTDASNKDLKRAREDLNTSLSDSAADYKQSQKRSLEDYNTSLTRSEDEFKKNIRRQADDLKKTLGDSEKDFHDSQVRNAKEFNISLTNSRADLNRNIGYMNTDAAIARAQAIKDHKQGLKDMATDIADSEKVISADMKTLSDAVGKAMAGRTVAWGKVFSSDADAWVTKFKTDMIPKFQAAFSDAGFPPPTQAVSQSPGNISKRADQINQRLDKHAEGGRIDGYSPHPKADNILARLTAGEFVMPVAAVDHYGVGFMESVRSKQMPRSVAMPGYAEGGAVGGQAVASRTGTEALAAALSQMTNAVGMCLAVVQEWWQSGHSFPDAWAQWMGTVQHRDGNPPIGAPVFFSGGKHGHVAIYAGNGLIRSTDWPSAGKTGNVPLMTLATQWHKPYVGWGSTLNNRQLRFDVGPGGSANFVVTPSEQQVAPVNPVTQDMVDGWVKEMNDIWPFNPIAGLTEAMRVALEDRMNSAPDAASIGIGPVVAGGTGAEHNKEIARQLLGRFGWGTDQFNPLVVLWNGESGWNEKAKNPSSGAYGIPQSLPASKMSSVASDYLTNAQTQILWGMGYIHDRYGSPAGALSKWTSRRPHWYDGGGLLMPGTAGANATDRPEPVLTEEQWRNISVLAKKAAVDITAADAATTRAAGGMHVVVHHNEKTFNDYSNNFDGASFTVMSNDPNEMARKLEAKAAADRLTATRGATR